MKNFIFLLLFSNTILAQVRFNKSYLYQQNKIEATSTLELPDGYLISERIVLSNDSAIGLGIRKIDLLGNNIWHKILSHPGTQIIASKNAMHFGVNNSIWISCTYSDSLLTLIPSEGMLININTNGDSLFSVKFGGPQSDRVYNSIVDNDGNIVCAGAKYIAANKDNPWAVKFDQNGNLLWENQLSNSASSFSRYFLSVSQNNDGDYFFVGNYGILPLKFFHAKIKNDGTTIWKTALPNFNIGSYEAIGVCAFGNKFFVSGNKWVSLSRGGSLSVHFDNGIFNGYLEHGYPPSDSEFHSNVLALDSAKFALAGRAQKHNGDSAYWGWFVNYEYPNSIIWDRTYHYNNSSDHLFYDLKRTSDGGFLLCGFNKNDSLNVNNSWVVKLDSNGCDVPDCELLGVKEINYTDELVFQIYPNPAQNFIDIKIIGSKKKHCVQIFGMDGILIKEVFVNNTDRIQLEQIANGIYLLKVSDISGSNKMLYQKFIINN
jgi:hypothetical protein